MFKRLIALSCAVALSAGLLCAQTEGDKAKGDKGKSDKAAADKTSGLDKEGFITRWLLLAPIPLPEAKANENVFTLEHIKGEAALKPKAQDKITVGKKELTWKPYQAKEYYFDVNEFLGEQIENHVGYAVCYIQADKEMKGLEARIGTNDHGKIYLNGKDIFFIETGRAIEKDQDSVKDITLKQGANVLVFKVINDTNDWAGCIRFMSKDGKPVTDLKVTLTPP